MRKLWPFMASFWGYGAFAVFVPLLVVHYADLGFTGFQIGLLTGLPPIVAAFGAPLWTTFADRTGVHRRIWLTLLVVALLLIVALAGVTSFGAVLTILLVFNLVMSPFVSFLDTSTMHMLGDEKDQYGRVRVGATLGFASFAWVGGTVAEESGITTTFFAGAAALLVALVFIRRLEFGDSATVSSSGDVGLLTMLREVRWLAFGALGIAGGIGFTLTAGYFYPFMENVGAAASTIGLAIFVGTMTEVPILFWGHRFLAALRPFVLLVATVAFTGARFVAMSFAESVGTVFFWQVSHGLTFVLMWLAAVAYADAHAPVGRKTTAQGLFAAATMGVGAAVGGLAAGPILSVSGADTLYRVGGAAIVAIAAAAGLVGRRVERSAAESAAEQILVQDRAADG